QTCALPILGSFPHKSGPCSLVIDRTTVINLPVNPRGGGSETQTRCCPGPRSNQALSKIVTGSDQLAVRTSAVLDFQRKKSGNRTRISVSDSRAMTNQ